MNTGIQTTNGKFEALDNNVYAESIIRDINTNISDSESSANTLISEVSIIDGDEVIIRKLDGNTYSLIASGVSIEPKDFSTAGINIILTNGNYTLEANTGSWTEINAYSNAIITNGKVYWEILVGRDYVWCGVSPTKTNQTAAFPTTVPNSIGYYGTGQKANGGTAVSYGLSYGAGDIVGVEFNRDNGQCTFYKNGVSQGVAYTEPGIDMYPAVGMFGSATYPGSCTVIFDAGSLTYLPEGATPVKDRYIVDTTSVTAGETPSTVYLGSQYIPVGMSVKNISAEYVLANISQAPNTADTLNSLSELIEGEKVIIQKDDDTIHEMTIGTVSTGGTPTVYTIDTSSVTAGEIVTRAYNPNAKIYFNDVVAPLLSNSLSYVASDVADTVDYIPIAYDYVTGNITISASSEYSISYPAWEASRNVTNNSDYCWLSGVSLAPPHWWQFELNDASTVKIVGYKIWSRASIDAAPKDWILQGSNDGITWTDLDTRSGESFLDAITPKSYYFDNQNAYNKYRIYITANNGNVSYTNIAEIEFYQAITGPMILENVATYDETEIGGNFLTTKVELTAAGDTCRSINLDLWVKP